MINQTNDAFEIICPYCNSKVTLQSSKKVYNKDYGLMYICSRYPVCDTYASANKITGRPSGTPANGELRAARKNANNAFQEVLSLRGKKCRSGKVKRLFISMIASELKISEKQCVISFFDLDMCQHLIRFCRSFKL